MAFKSPMARLRVVVEKADGVDYVRLSGPLHESTQEILEGLAGQLGPTVFVDLEKVESVNSYGVRGWCLAMATLKATRSVTLEKVPPGFVMAANAVPEMVRKIEVKDVFRGYNCRANHYWWELVPVATLDLSRFEKNLIRCPKCTAVAEAEVSKEEYFEFVFAKIEED